jgi:outer membrane protein assembly factor BamE
MQKILRVFFLSTVILIWGCAIYKIDVRQGNLVTQEMLDQLQWGMPAQKVKFIMGTPLMVDVFHQDRWDYLYSFQAGGEEGRKQRHLALFFDENDRLVKIEGDVKVSAQRIPKPSPPSDELGPEPIL